MVNARELPRTQHWPHGISVLFILNINRRARKNMSFVGEAREAAIILNMVKKFLYALEEQLLKNSWKNNV